MNSLKHDYLIGRTRVDVEEVRDFETFKISKIMYFLYLDPHDGTLDAINSKSTKFNQDMNKTCSVGTINKGLGISHDNKVA